jgi:carbon dioxide concentrating mechanism protein CcmM
MKQKRIGWPNVHPNVKTSFNEEVKYPSIEQTAFIHPFAVVIGDCHIGEMVMMAPTAVCRGDEGTPIHIGGYSNIQDGVVLHALETTEEGKNLDGRKYSAGGDLLLGNDTRFADDGYAIWVGERTSLAHGSLVHGPAWIGNDTFVGMEAMVFNAKVGNNVAIGVSSTITGGVTIADNKFVPPGSVITTQEQADALPSRIGSTYENINKGVIHVNENLAEQYDGAHLEKLIKYREAEMEKGMLETGQHSPK